MACWLTVSSHYPNQSSLYIGEILRDIQLRVTESYHSVYWVPKIIILKLLPQLPGANELSIISHLSRISSCSLTLRWISAFSSVSSSSSWYSSFQGWCCNRHFSVNAALAGTRCGLNTGSEDKTDKIRQISFKSQIKVQQITASITQQMRGLKVGGVQYSISTDKTKTLELLPTATWIWA